MEERSLLLRLTGNISLFRILNFLIENKGMNFTKADISKGAKISRASMFNNWKELEKYSIIKVTGRHRNAKLYTLDSESQVTKRILDLELALISEALSRTKIRLV